jgi:hypothetical protein
MPRITKIGRPKLPKGQAREVFPIRLSAAERSAVIKAAKAADKKPTEWARNAMLGLAGYIVPS